jgi:hypothetical protein
MSFGVDTDPWGFADTHIKIQSATPHDSSATEAQCEDSNGDVNESTMHDTTNAIVATYQSCHDTALVFYDTTAGVDFRLGKVIGGKVITSIEVATSNKERPTITITGESTSAADTSVQKYDPSDLEISGERKATKIGATVDTNSKLVGSSATASVTVVKVLDSDGNEACKDVHGGRVEATDDFVGCAGAPGASEDTGWTKSAGSSEAQENTAYATGSIAVFKNLSKM